MARRDKKAFLSDQCKEIEENNRMGKTRDLVKKKHIISLIPDKPIHRHTLEISQVQFQTTTKQTLQ